MSFLAILILVVLAAAAVFAAVNFRTITRIRRERSKVRQLEERSNVFVSARTERSLHHSLTDDEHSILWADRRHWITAARIILALFLVAVLLILTAVAAAWQPRFSLPASNGSSQHYSVNYLWVLPLVIAAASAFVGWTQWLNWSADYRLLSNKRIMLVHQPWAWAIWLWNSEKSDPLPLEAVTTVETKSTYWGRIFGYGSVIVKSLLQDSEDEEFHEINFTPRYKEFKEAIEEAVKDTKVHLVAVSGSVVPVEDVSE